jgi:hypothetical protein
MSLKKGLESVDRSINFTKSLISMYERVKISENPKTLTFDLKEKLIT